MKAIHPWARAGFERAARDYDVGRPSYAREGIAWMAERVGLAPRSVIVDVGAGTGKLTSQLTTFGAHVFAVEPVAAMRKHLERLPTITVLDAAAEQIPLADGQADVVTVAQAVHWFDPGSVVSELHRIIRPDGWLVLARNELDPFDPLSAALTQVIERFRGHPPVDRGARELIERGEMFTADRRRSVKHAVTATRREVEARVVSESSIALAERVDLGEIWRAIGALVERPTVRICYRTDIALYQRR